MGKVVKKESAELAVSNEPVIPINVEDLILPTVVLRQNSYKKPHMKPFKPGDVILRPDDECIADEEKVAPFIPVHIEKVHRIVLENGSESRTLRYDPWRANLEWEFEEDGQTYRRDECYVAHVLFKDKLKAQNAMLAESAAGGIIDPSDFVLPTRIVFTRAGRIAGKTLAAHFELSRAVRQPPYVLGFSLRSTELSNDKGAWYAFVVEKLKEDKFTSKDDYPICKFWHDSMTKLIKLKSVEDDQDEGQEYNAQAEDRF